MYDFLDYTTRGGHSLPDFELIPGVYIASTDGVERSYRAEEGRIVLALSSKSYQKLFPAAVKCLNEPLFFFLEVPSGEDFELYYLDNCTLPVILAILKRYSGILYSDGVIRFGFGSHITGDELYMREYQRLEIYSQKGLDNYKKILDGLGYRHDPGTKTLWDIISEDNPISGESVECDDESFKDIIENLAPEGMYKCSQGG